MESLESLRMNTAKLEQLIGADGRFDIFKFTTCTKTEWPVHYRMMKMVFADLLSEGVSESCFSTHSAFATDLRKNTAPVVISSMVYCNRNHKLLYHKVQGKVKARYEAKYGKVL